MRFVSVDRKAQRALQKRARGDTADRCHELFLRGRPGRGMLRAIGSTPGFSSRRSSLGRAPVL